MNVAEAAYHAPKHSSFLLQGRGFGIFGHAPHIHKLPPPGKEHWQSYQQCVNFNSKLPNKLRVLSPHSIRIRLQNANRSKPINRLSHNIDWAIQKQVTQDLQGKQCLLPLQPLALLNPCPQNHHGINQNCTRLATILCHLRQCLPKISLECLRRSHFQYSIADAPIPLNHIPPRKIGIGGNLSHNLANILHRKVNLV